MSAAAAAPSKSDAVDATPVKMGKKKLVIIGAAVLALLLAGGTAAGVYVMKKRAADAAAAAEAEDGADDSKEAAAHATVKADLKHAPVFVPLDMFTVNLADRDTERYAQVGVTLELMDAKAGDLLKAYMPAIRNNILLVLASKPAAQLMEHEGKLQLAAEIRAAALKPLGYAIEMPKPATAAPEADAAEGHADAQAKPKAKPKAKPTPEDPDIPVRAVHFSNFIIQ